MLPEFNDNGYLPAGIHVCDVEEVAVRFGAGSPEREIETKELLEFIEWSRRAGVQRLIINGSYVTATQSPNDVDIVILPGEGYPRAEPPYSEQNAVWPFLQIVVAVDEADLMNWAMKDFGTDRELIEKGVVEVLL
jgi:hypothetical protein